MPPIIFRKLQENQQPGPGELWIRPTRPADRDRRATALLVLEHGLNALERGSGQVNCIIVDAAGTQPTFDEMLAAWFARRLLDGQQLPECLRSIAEYARLMRQGLTPTRLPPEETIEGIYQAVRNLPGDDLTQPLTARAFLDRWERLADRLLRAAKAGRDVFKRSLFASGSAFAEEKAYLRNDENIYCQDVARGERWKVRLPGGPPEASALLLREPKSLLFAFWSRRDRRTPTGEPYLFLAVDWGKAEWVFSTNPVGHISLAGLAERLQEAEEARVPAAKNNAWYDGRDHQYSLVAAPRGGTKLSNRQVRHIVRAWTKPTRDFRPLLKKAVVGAAAIVLLVGLGILIQKPESVAPPRIAPPPCDHKLLFDGQPVLNQRGIEGVPESVVFGFRRNVTLEPHGSHTHVLEEENRFQNNRPIRLRLHLRPEDSRQNMTAGNLEVRLNDEKLKLSDENVHEQDREVKAELSTALKSGRNRIKLQLCNLSDKPIKAILEVNWIDDFSHVTLHVLAVGVSKYHCTRYNLRFADKDAQDLVEFFQKSQSAGTGSRLFHQVITYPQTGPLLNNLAIKSDILNQLAALQDKAAEHDLILIFFSGHGKKFENSDHYYFLPYDYDPEKQLPATALAWDIIKQYLEGVKCRVVIVMDTCHSGAISGMKGDPTEDLTKAVERALEDFSRAKRGIILLAACLGDQQARESSEWGHGALTKAVLECLVEKKGLEEKKQQSDSGVITLADVADYARKRVAQLVKGGNSQAVVLRPFADIAPQQIPISVYEKTNK